jgi:hypothetical protein
MYKYAASAVVAAGDTTKTSLGSLTVPAGVKKIVGVWAYALGGPGITTLENVTGIVELESVDIPVQPCQIPLEPVGVLTGGTPASQIKVWPLDIPVASVGSIITAYVTMDMAQTVANTCRWGLWYEI